MGGSDLMFEKEVAARLGRRPETLRKWRWEGASPPFYRINGRICYRWIEVEDWITERRG